jgi:hypothetical protein
MITELKRYNENLLCEKKEILADKAVFERVSKSKDIQIES